jgi:SNF2 family DNA or RNA helicase
MKTKGMNHQLEALRRMNGVDFFGLFMEQGTGKTWTILADAERLYASGKIDGLLVIAPKGVHTNWVRREIPMHMEGAIISRAWASGMGKRARAHVDEILRPREDGETVPLRVFAINIDALNTKDGLAFARQFLLCTKSMIAVDESSRIKNPDAARTRAIMKLRPLAKFARIATGTPITNAPMDIFSQMEFLESGLLGTTSYRAFTAQYAELMSPNHPMMKELIKRNPKAAHAQMVMKNSDGTPRWKNLDKLQALLMPHVFRVLKRECLDLPEKIFQQVYFDLGLAQMKAYELMKKDFRIEVGDGAVLAVAELAALIKLQQITSGFVMQPKNGGLMYVGEDNPRLDALMGIVSESPQKTIIWARFKEELRTISAALRKAGKKVVEYHGDVGTADRELAIDGFQNGDVDVFVGQPQSGGIGITLTAAELVVYYSNDFNLETRLQSEDRAHRIGTKRNVVYIDLVAAGTIDESIARALQRKSGVASTILGDGSR